MKTTGATLHLTKQQAFTAAYKFFVEYFNRQESVGLRTILSGMLLNERGQPWDSGTMYTWVEGLAAVRGVDVAAFDNEALPDQPSASLEEWFGALAHFLHHHAEVWQSDQFQKILDDVQRSVPGAEPDHGEAWRRWQALGQQCSDMPAP